MNRWRREQHEAWREQIFEMQAWRHVRRPAGAVMCETRDLGIKWPQCTPYYLREIAEECGLPAGWAAKHESEELKEGV